MRISGRLVQGRFVERANRFLVRVDLDGRLVPAFLPNPGRLRELLRPRAPLLLRPMFQGKRKTALDVLAVRTEGKWVCVDTRLANALMEEALKAKAVPGLWPYDAVVPESAHGRSRFDFLLPRGRMRGYVEVKSVTLLAGGVALFPDAPTLRGARHVDDLLALRRRGYGAAVLFLVHRDALVLRPNDATDPAFGTALRRAARGGVFVLAHRTVFDGRTLSLGPPLPVDLRPPPSSVGAA